MGDSVLIDGTTVKDLKDLLSSAKTYVIKGAKGAEPIEEAPERDRGGPSSVADLVELEDPNLVSYGEQTPKSRGAQMERRRYSGSVVNDNEVGVKE